MLVLARKKGESIIIDDEIEVRVVSVEGDVVKLGISAPKSTSIHRKEVFEAIQAENKAAVQSNVDISHFINLKKD
jgi:carbon storage regulator